MQSLLFSFQGRTNRAKFWLVHIAMWVVMAAVVAAIFGRHRVPYGPHRYYSRSWHAASSRWRA